MLLLANTNPHLGPEVLQGFRGPVSQRPDERPHHRIVCLHGVVGEGKDGGGNGHIIKLRSR